MFEEKKQQFIKSRETLELTLEEEKKTREILEERRKRDEETFLKPIIEKEDKEKKVLKEKKMEMIEFLKQQLQIFSGESADAKKTAEMLLEAFVFVSSIDKQMPKELKDSTASLYEYFLKVEDIESAVTFLKARCGTLFKEDELVKRRQEYIEYLAKHPTPVVEQNSKYILNYGEYIDDIVKLFEVCGRLDKKSAPKDYEGIYYTEETALLMAMGALDEFGDIAGHLYYVPPFGTQDSDRETLVYYHDRAYLESVKETQKTSEESKKEKQ